MADYVGTVCVWDELQKQHRVHAQAGHVQKQTSSLVTRTRAILKTGSYGREEETERERGRLTERKGGREKEKHAGRGLFLAVLGHLFRRAVGYIRLEDWMLTYLTSHC